MSQISLTNSLANQKYYILDIKTLTIVAVIDFAIHLKEFH